MIGRLNHVAIAVGDIAKASKVYRDTLGADVSAKVAQPDHGVSTVFITLPNTKIELLEPLGADSPIAKFLERNPDGGIHHVCYEVADIRVAREKLKAQVRAFSATANRRSVRTANRSCFFIPRISAERWLSWNRLDASDEHDHRDRHLFPDLVDHAVRSIAVGGTQSGRKRRGDAGD